MNLALRDQICTLPRLNRAQLLPIWAENFSTPPPPKLRKELMVQILAYRIQEREYGGLSHSARKRLRALAVSIGQERQGAKTIRSSDPDSGTRLVRLWRGEVHEVTCRNGVYTHRAEQFTSLSKIARVITGTQWSGPAFFGTKK